MPRLRHLAAVLAVLATSTAPLAAQSVNQDRQGLGLHGYDPVAYHEAARAVRGAPDLSAEYEGTTYRFASTANRDAFLAAPARFLPAYGGYCAYGVSRGYKVKVDPEAFSVIGGRLYLNYDKGVQKEWLKATATYIARADSIWPGIREAPRR